MSHQVHKKSEGGECQRLVASGSQEVTFIIVTRLFLRGMNDLGK